MWLYVSPVEDTIPADNGVFVGVKVAEVVENVDARPGCAGQPPDWTTAFSTGLVLILLVTGAFYFRRTERTIVDSI